MNEGVAAHFLCDNPFSNPHQEHDFLVQFTDCSCRYPTFPQSFNDIFHTSNGYTGQIYLDKNFFFPRGDPLEFRYSESNISGYGGKIAAVVPDAISLPLLAALTSGVSPCQLLSFRIPHIIRVSAILPRISSLS